MNNEEIKEAFHEYIKGCSGTADLLDLVEHSMAELACLMDDRAGEFNKASFHAKQLKGSLRNIRLILLDMIEKI